LWKEPAKRIDTDHLAATDQPGADFAPVDHALYHSARNSERSGGLVDGHGDAGYSASSSILSVGGGCGFAHFVLGR
jgi:hypothetical protein